MVRKAGAKEVHVRIGSPPILAPCYLGIDMASREELIAAYKTVAGVEAVIGADSLGYVSHKGLVEAIGIPRTPVHGLPDRSISCGDSGREVYPCADQAV